MRISYLPATLWTVSLTFIELTLSGTAWAALAGAGAMALVYIKPDKLSGSTDREKGRRLPALRRFFSMPKCIEQEMWQRSIQKMREAHNAEIAAERERLTAHLLALLDSTIERRIEQKLAARESTQKRAT